jgi:hypothetical protein
LPAKGVIAPFPEKRTIHHGPGRRRVVESRKPRHVRGCLTCAFGLARRWEWVDRNPAESARPPAVNTRKSIPATPPEDVAKVIVEAGAHSTALGLYLWLVVITGQRRGGQGLILTVTVAAWSPAL